MQGPSTSVGRLDGLGSLCLMASSKVNAVTKVKVVKTSARYDTSGKRVLSDAEVAKVRRQGARAKSFSVKTSKAS